MAISPMMQQYLEIKEQYNDCLLFFRLGDFYEMFFDDAKTASKELELVLTGKDYGEPERAPMCGVPYHSAESYIAKLVANGHRVAICEQIEDPKLAKGIVQRDVIRIITPGTVTENAFLNENENNYICALCFDEQGYGAAFADISTSEVYATDIEGADNYQGLFSECAPYSPKELFALPSVPKQITDHFVSQYRSLITHADKRDFDKENADRLICSVSGGSVPDDISDNAKAALGALLSYITRTQKVDISYIKEIKYYKSNLYLMIDSVSRRSLELDKNIQTLDKRGTLLSVIDRTRTSMGGRMIKKWLDRPLMNCRMIAERQNAVKELLGDIVKLAEIRETLKKITDIERISTRLVFGTANARDMKSLEISIDAVNELKGSLSSFSSPLMKELYSSLDTLDDVKKEISETIDDDPPFSVREGRIIKDGFNEDVDNMRSMMKDGTAWITKIESYEKETTGIKNLKIGYNKVFGYYIEVSNSFLDRVPERYHRKQTLVNGERFITKELKEMESTVLTSKERDAALEYDIFCGLRGRIIEQIGRIHTTASAVARLDALCSLAAVADENSYVCPEVDASDVIDVKDGRHPVVESVFKNTYFVPNDCFLNTGKNMLSLITGPNMAGKSTYMRQNALIVILAQMGSFVPASSARIGLVDRIFTRIGASDDLSGGRSTFMLEMTEVASILKNATAKSLILYDEIGRGTSTYDGMSIAQAVVEYTVKKIGAKTLFATHYHELTELENEIDGVVNYNITAKKRGGEVVFLRKIVRGAAESSYGIEVGQLAGLPKEVISKAKKVLGTLEAQGFRRKKESTEDANVSFEDITELSVIDKLKETDINTITPIEAMSLLYDLKRSVE